MTYLLERHIKRDKDGKKLVFSHCFFSSFALICAGF